MCVIPALSCVMLCSEASDSGGQEGGHGAAPAAHARRQQRARAGGSPAACGGCGGRLAAAGVGRDSGRAGNLNQAATHFEVSLSSGLQAFKFSKHL